MVWFDAQQKVVKGMNSSAEVLLSGIYFMYAPSGYMQSYAGGSNFTVIL